MKKTLRYIFYSLLLIVILMGAFHVGSLYEKTQNPHTNKIKITSSMIKSQLVDAEDLVTEKYVYTHLGKYENSRKINGWDIPLTKKYFLLQFDGEIQAGIDLQKVQVHVHDHQITVDTPDIKILSHSIDEKSIQVYDEKNNVFNPINTSDFKTFTVNEKKAALKIAKQKGLIKDAKKNTKRSIKHLIYMMPDIKDTYTIQVNIGADTK